MSDDRFDVIVIGGGPAGIAAGIALRKRGIARVVVLERETEAGGAPRHCGHLPYGVREFGRLMTGPRYARTLRERAARYGLAIETRTSVVRLKPSATIDVASPAGLRTLHARRIIIATGSRETPRAARLISGDRPQNVVTTATLQQFLHIEHVTPFVRPLVVGSEIVAVSALLTCVRHGMRPVAVVESSDRTATRVPVRALARVLRVPFFLNASLDTIGGRRIVEFVDVGLRESRRRIACDAVIFTGRFEPEIALARSSMLALNEAADRIAIDRAGRCSDRTYVLAGNVARVDDPAGPCYRDGHRVGNLVADELATLLDSVDR